MTGKYWRARVDFFVIVPVYNAGPKIAKTLQSVLEQSTVLSGQDTLRCVVIDGASTDDTLEHVRRFDDTRIDVISEADEGMYDALAKGLAMAAGDVTCYLPAGECFEFNAFSIVSNVLAQYEEVTWLMGRAVTRNAAGQITDSVLPHPIRRHFIDCGMYGTRLMAIQQESTFWRSALNASIDLSALRKLKLAGDYFMWKCLAQTEDLYIVNAQLGSFTIEPGQLSKSVPGGYRGELRRIRRRPTLLERLSALVHRQFAKRMIPRKTAKRLISYDHKSGDWKMSRP